MNKIKKFRKGDQVIVTSGKDKGKTGEIIKVLSKKDAVVVKGANIYKRHRKATQNTPGGILSLERPLATAKVTLVESGKPVRAGFKRGKKGPSERISKKTGKKI